MVMSGKVYLLSTLLLIAGDAWIGTFFWMFLSSMAFNPIYLVSFVILDIIFIISNINKLRFKRLELFIVLILAFHLTIGIFILPKYSKSYDEITAIKDTVLPIMFIMKILIFRKIFSRRNIKNYKKVLLISCLAIVTIQIFIFIISPMSELSVGLNPPVNVLLGAYFAGGPLIFLAISILVLLLAGKRSIFLSLIVAGIVSGGRNLKIFIIFSCLFLLGFFLVDFTDSSSINLIDKIAISYNAIMEISDFSEASEARNAALYIATAGRSEEFFAIFRFMEPINWLIGIGPGFSYSFDHPSLGYIDRSNAHFTPLSISYKFGLIIGVFFLFYVSKDILWGLRNSQVFLSTILLLFLVQSFFSFNIFVEILYPIIISWLSFYRAEKNTSKNSADNF